MVVAANEDVRLRRLFNEVRGPRDLAGASRSERGLGLQRFIERLALGLQFGEELDQRLLAVGRGKRFDGHVVDTGLRLRHPLRVRPLLSAHRRRQAGGAAQDEVSTQVFIGEKEGRKGRKRARV